MSSVTATDRVLDWVKALHRLVDELARPVAYANESRLRCRAGCADCCVDDLTVFEIEAKLIVRHYPELVATADPHPPGACAFLDRDGRCRIYAHRPYVCRTQGLPLRWLEDGASGDVLEVRDICPLNVDGGPELEDLDPSHCWTIGPFETRLLERQRAVDGGLARRVSLRSLFARERTRRRLPIVES